MSQRELLINILKKIEEEQRGIMNGWAKGDYTGPSQDETIQRNSQALGCLEGLHIAGSIIDDILEELNDD